MVAVEVAAGDIDDVFAGEALQALAVVDPLLVGAAFEFEAL